jgi:hypothetical protein
MKRLFLLLGLALGLVVAGCMTQPAAQMAPAAAAPAPSVKILAYINVSSGCQQSTVDLLKYFQQKYGRRLKLEFIDFGDGGSGSDRWQASGYHCMTIEINGSPIVKFPDGGTMKAVAFEMPAGFNWSLDDLSKAVTAAMAGKLQPATAAEAEGAETPQLRHAKVATAQETRNGQKFAEVTINGNLALMLPAAAQGKARAAAAAKALKSWLAKPVKGTDLHIKQAGKGWVVTAAGKPVVTLTGADAKAMGKPAQDLAKYTVSSINHALAAPKH